MRNNDNKLEYSGERFTPETKGFIELEHIHRYLFASQFVKDKCVLDIASGEGYGSAMLANYASSVVGVDISNESIEHARKKYKNVNFLVGDCSDIPLDTSSVDVVISFETIEHHDKHDKMINEIKRVLRPGGVLVMSSPDKYEYSEKTSYVNPWHVKELYLSEFEELISDNFKNRILLGQRIVFGSLIVSEEITDGFLSYGLSGVEREGKRGLDSPLFWLTVASDEQLPLIEPGILEQSIEDTDLFRQLGEFKNWAITADEYAKSLKSELDKVSKEFQSVVNAYSIERSSFENEIKNQIEAGVVSEEYAKSLQEELDKTQKELESIRSVNAAERASYETELNNIKKWAVESEEYAKSLKEELVKVRGELESVMKAYSIERASYEDEMKSLREWGESSETYAKSLKKELDKAHNNPDSQK